jgi:hypothetical protein
VPKIILRFKNPPPFTNKTDIHFPHVFHPNPLFLSLQNLDHFTRRYFLFMLPPCKKNSSLARMETQNASLALELHIRKRIRHPKLGSATVPFAIQAIGVMSSSAANGALDVHLLGCVLHGDVARLLPTTAVVTRHGLAPPASYKSGRPILHPTITTS